METSEQKIKRLEAENAQLRRELTGVRVAFSAQANSVNQLISMVEHRDFIISHQAKICGYTAVKGAIHAWYGGD